MKKINNFFGGITLLFFLCTSTMIGQNDLCSGAIPLSCNSTVAGSTVGSTFDGVGTCGTSNTAPGVWYTFTGNGGLATLSTCNQAGYDTKISVFSGSCGSLSCVGGNDDGPGCSGFTSKVDVPTISGTTYYVLVHGFGSATGNFNLSLSCADAPSGNDACSGAADIACGSSVSGTTVGATVDSAGFCGTSNTAPGVWYKFQGDGSFVIASLCDSSYDTKISVFSGSCGALSCVGGNDDACGLRSEVEFATTSGTIYYILVHGFGSATGSFNLNMSCVSPPDNDICAEATTIACGDTLSGSTTAASAEPGLSCSGLDLSTAGGVWYKFNGTGDEIDITLSTAGSNFDTKLGVFSGDCNNLICVASDDDDGPGLTSQLSFMSEVDEDYYIYVTGFSSASGDYDISLSCALQAKMDSDCNTVYYGWPAESTAQLSVFASYGTAPYTYAWDNGITSTDSSVSVSPSVTTVYTVTVTDANGDSVQVSTTVIAVDVTCGNSNNGKVLVCHKTESDSNPYNTICIAPSAVQTHLDHGDLLGECGSYTCETLPSCDVTVASPENGSTDVSIDTDIIWTDASLGFVTGYEVTIGTTPGGSDVAANINVGNTTSYDPGTLEYDTTYYVTVASYNGAGTASGCLETSFTTSEGTNDLCQGALSIACGDNVFGSTVGATNDGDPTSFCGTTPGYHGVWYTFVGDGSTYTTASTCGTASFDTKINVYSGSCNALVCEGGNDDVSGCSGFTSEVTFDTVSGTTYYILVSSYSSSSSGEGEFELTLTCANSGRMAGPDFGIHPNPSKTSTVHLDLRDYLNQDLNIQVLDVRGNVINREELLNLSQPTHTMQLNNAVNGMYFVRVQTNRGVTTKKLIIAY